MKKKGEKKIYNCFCFIIYRKAEEKEYKKIIFPTFTKKENLYFLFYYILLFVKNYIQMHFSSSLLTFIYKKKGFFFNIF